jgi:F-type H+-transporting ATPase subunit b
MATPTHEGTTAPAAPSGLPQFDPQWWPGQIFWFLVIFAVVYLLMRYVFVPKIGGAIEARDGKIEGDIAQARALKDQADAEAATAAAETAQARAASQKLASDARDKAKAEIAARLADEEAKLNVTIEAAEARIRAARDQAMGNVAAIAADTAGAIVARLTGAPASAAEISAAMAGKA